MDDNNFNPQNNQDNGNANYNNQQNYSQPDYNQQNYSQPDYNNQGNFSQPNYTQPVYQQPNPGYNDPDKAVLTFGEWLITLLIICIPCVNIIMLFVWAFGSGNENRKNFCRAQLVLMAIGVVISIIFSSALVGMVASMANSYNF